MSKVQNLPVPLKPVKEFIAAVESNASPEVQGAAAKVLMDAMKEALNVLEAGFNRKELTVCNGILGFISPEDAARFMSREIPRLTVYHSSKDARNMSVHIRKPPNFYKERAKCTTGKKSTRNTTTGTHKRRASPNGSSGPKPTKK